MSDNRFSKDNRLRKEADFSRVYEEGRRDSGDYFVFYLLQKEETKPRIGIVTPKCVGKAVTRNQIKRIIRESFRKNKEKFEGYDLIVKPKEKVNELSNSVLAEKFLNDHPSQ